MMELQAKIVEHDETRQKALIKSLTHYPKVVARAVGGQIHVLYEGGERDIGVFHEIMSICENNLCCMFQLEQKKGGAHYG